MTENNVKSLEQRVEELEIQVAELKVLLISEDSKSTVKPKDKVSINEFLKNKNTRNEVQLTLVIAYWLDYFEKVDSFNVSDLENTFRSARLSVPKNINDKVNMNIKNGHMAEHKEKKNGKKAWYVTNTGVEFVEKTLNKEQTP